MERRYSMDLTVAWKLLVYSMIGSWKRRNSSLPGIIELLRIDSFLSISFDRTRVSATKVR